MSFATLERAVLKEARIVLSNPKLRQKDIIEWSSGRVDAGLDEVAVRLPELGVAVVVLKECDKR